MRRYLTLNEVLVIHEILIHQFGGSEGIRDMNALESAVGRVQTGYYKDIIEESAALIESLAKNHPFIDGNKRIAFFAADVFLRMNGRFIDCDSDDTHRFFMGLFEKKTFRFKELHHWLTKHVNRIDAKE